MNDIHFWSHDGNYDIKNEFSWSNQREIYLFIFGCTKNLLHTAFILNVTKQFHEKWANWEAPCREFFCDFD